MSAQWSSNLSDAYVLIQDTFKDKKNSRASMKLSPPSALEPYKISWVIQFLFTGVRVDPVLTNLQRSLSIFS